MLVDFGHRVITAGDGPEALGLLASEPTIDLLITDFAMPHLSGSELVRRARTDLPGLPAIMITGNADAVEAADTADGMLMLFKPFTPDQMHHSVIAATSSPLEAKVA